MTAMRLVAFLFLFLPLLVPDNAWPEADERKGLADEQALLSDRIDELKKEQDYLLFERSLSGTDSKYLVLDLTAGVCRLKYRNRTLRSFEVALSSSLREGLRRGSYTLTAKEDGNVSGRALVFRDELVLHGKRYAKRSAAGKRPTGIAIGKMDLAALFFALDSGSRLYVLH